MNKFPKIMAIVNATHDSFSDGGDYYCFETAVNYIKQVIDSGEADIIDIGGESSRPGADTVSLDEEIKRTIPIIEEIRRYNQKIQISIDTVKYEVAKLAIEAGANIINDISGLKSDIRMGQLAAAHNVAYILMHRKGTAKDMQINPQYDNIQLEVFNFLQSQIKLAKDLGIKSIYADFGIGFGKNYQHNVELLKNISFFYKLNVPLVLGISRKRFIGEMTNIEKAKDRDLATLLIHTLLLKENIDIIRVHNLKEYKLLKRIFLELL